MNALSRILLAFAFAGAMACAGTAPAQNTDMTAALPPSADAELLNTYWKILSFAGEAVAVAPGKRKPHVILRSADGRDSWSASVGCNQMSGAVAVTGDRIAFKSGVATLMACPPPLDTLERTLSQSLTASTQWRIEGNRLELRDDAGAQTLLCEAVYPE